MIIIISILGLRLRQTSIAWQSTRKRMPLEDERSSSSSAVRPFKEVRFFDEFLRKAGKWKVNTQGHWKTSITTNVTCVLKIVPHCNSCKMSSRHMSKSSRHMSKSSRHMSKFKYVHICLWTFRWKQTCFLQFSLCGKLTQVGATLAFFLLRHSVERLWRYRSAMLTQMPIRGIKELSNWSHHTS